MAKTLRLPWWGVLCGIVAGVPLAWLFDHFGKLNLFLPALLGASMVVGAVVIKWPLRGLAWFWITIGVVVGLHVPLIWFVPWTGRRVPAAALVPFGIADLFTVLAIVAAVRRFMEGNGGIEGIRDGGTTRRGMDR